MRAYIASARVRYTPEQLELLVPAFDAAWAVVRRDRGWLPGSFDERAARDRLARVVVDLVTRGHMRTIAEIANAAVIVVRDQGRVMA